MVKMDACDIMVCSRWAGACSRTFAPFDPARRDAVNGPAVVGNGGMRRRDFITAVGGATIAWPVAARAQQAARPIIGFLHGGSAAERAHLVTAFRQGLAVAGYVEGQNVMIEYRWAEDQFDRLPALAAELVSRGVSVVATPGSAV